MGTDAGTEYEMLMTMPSASVFTASAEEAGARVVETQRYIVGSASPSFSASGILSSMTSTTDPAPSDGATGVGTSTGVAVESAVVRLLRGRDCFFRRRLMVSACSW
jgi:hypothetical protein